MEAVRISAVMKVETMPRMKSRVHAIAEEEEEEEEKEKEKEKGVQQEEEYVSQLLVLQREVQRLLEVKTEDKPSILKVVWNLRTRIPLTSAHLSLEVER
jgi:hypothetical protein